MTEPNSESLDLDELDERIIARDESALTDLLRHFGPRISSVLRTRFPVLNEADVEEILSEALYRLWLHYDPSRGTVGQLFVRIAVNRALDVLAARRQPITFSPYLDMIAAVELPVETSQESARYGGAMSVLHSVLQELNADDRRILQTYAELGGEGLPWTRLLAAELDITPENLRVRRHRLVDRVRREFQRRGWDPSTLSFVGGSIDEES